LLAKLEKSVGAETDPQRISIPGIAHRVAFCSRYGIAKSKKIWLVWFLLSNELYMPLITILRRVIPAYLLRFSYSGAGSWCSDPQRFHECAPSEL